MTRSQLLDTSILAQAIEDRPSPRVLDWWRETGDSAVGTSAACVAEILQGLECAAPRSTGGAVEDWSQEQSAS